MFLRILITAHANPQATPCHLIDRARVLSDKMNNDRADGHCYSFAWIFRNRFYFQLSPRCSKMNKKSIWEDFCPRDMETCHLAAARRVKLWSLNANLFFEEPHQLTRFAATVWLWPSSLTKPDLLRLWCSSGHVLSDPLFLPHWE